MEIKAQAKYIKISHRKLKLAADLVRRMKVQQAEEQLYFLPKKAKDFVLNLLKSCVANAEHNFHLKKDDLFIKNIITEKGPMTKRWMPKAFGRATPIRKRTAHLTIILEESKPVIKESISQEKAKKLDKIKKIIRSKKKK